MSGWIEELRKEKVGKEYCITRIACGETTCKTCKFKVCEKKMGQW